MKSLKAVLLTVAAVVGLSSGSAFARTLTLVNVTDAAVGFTVSGATATEAGWVPARGSRSFHTGDDSLTVDCSAAGVSSEGTASFASVGAVRAYWVDDGTGSGVRVLVEDGTYQTAEEAGSMDGLVWKFTAGLLLAGGVVWAFRSGVRDGYAK